MHLATYMNNPIWYPTRGWYLSISIPSGNQAMNAEVKGKSRKINILRKKKMRQLY